MKRDGSRTVLSICRLARVAGVPTHAPHDALVRWAVVDGEIHLGSGPLLVRTTAFALSPSLDGSTRARRYVSPPVQAIRRDRADTDGAALQSWIFYFVSGSLVLGVGTSLNERSCKATIVTTFVFYIAAKAMTFIFLSTFFVISSFWTFSHAFPPPGERGMLGIDARVCEDVLTQFLQCISSICTTTREESVARNHQCTSFPSR